MKREKELMQKHALSMHGSTKEGMENLAKIWESKKARKVRNKVAFQ